jgi:hypothetical protein
MASSGWHITPIAAGAALLAATLAVLPDRAGPPGGTPPPDSVTG